MRLLLHQALKDLRAQRWFVAAWAALLVAAASIEALKLDVTLAGIRDRGPSPATGLFFLIALTISRPVLGWLLAVRIVHADPVGDTNAFWLTRPLSPTMLMASKLGLLAVLFFVVPGFAAALVFVANNVALDRLPRSIVEWWMFDAVLLLPFVLLATLTRDLARIGIAAVAGAVAWLGLTGYATFVYVMNEEMIWSSWGSVYRTMALTTAACGLAIVALSLALIVWQYRTRRTAVTAWSALTAVVVLASVGALSSARFRSTGERPAPVIDNRWDGARNVSVSIPPDTIVKSPFSDRTVRLVGDIEVTGGDNVLIDVTGGRGTLRIPERGESVEEDDVRRFNFDPLVQLALGNEAGRRVFEHAIGARLTGRSYGAWNALSLADIRPDTFTGYQGMRATYEAELVLAAFRVVVSPAIPALPGLATGVGPLGVTLLPAFQPTKRRCWRSDIRESDPRAFLPPGTTRLGYVLRNRRRGEAVLLFRGSPQLIAQGLGSTFLTVSGGAARLDCGANDTPPVDDAWLADAELIMVSLEQLGTFSRHVVVPEFRLPVAK